MATYLAHIRVRPGMEERFERIAHDLYDATHANEQHARRYEYWRGTEPSTYYALGSFDHVAGFVAHQTSDHHEEAVPVLREVIESMRLEWVDPLPGASALAMTMTAPTPDDASDLEAQWYDRFADAMVADWWLKLR